MRTKYEQCVMGSDGQCTRFSHQHEDNPHLTPEDYQADLKREAEAQWQHWFINTNDDYNKNTHDGFIAGYLKGRADE